MFERPPAPLIIFSTFVGYLAGRPTGGLFMTLGFSLPAFTFPIALHRHLAAIAENPRIRTFLLGVTVGVIGLIAAVTLEMAEQGVVDTLTALLTLGAYLILNGYHEKTTVLHVVLGWGAIGALLQATVL
jgi:chromate transporter